MKKTGTKKVETKKVETKVDHYEVKVYVPARDDKDIVWGPSKGEKLKISQDFKSHWDALSAAKRILEEHPEYAVVEIHTFLDGPTYYCERAVYCSNIETVKKGYEIRETDWRSANKIYW